MTGKVTVFTNPAIDDPNAITNGPDGALWFTNGGNKSIGRISLRGTVTRYTGAGISQPTQSPPGRTARCGSPTAGASQSAASPPAGP